MKLAPRGVSAHQRGLKFLHCCPVADTVDTVYCVTSPPRTLKSSVKAGHLRCHQPDPQLVLVSVCCALVQCSATRLGCREQTTLSARAFSWQYAAAYCCSCIRAAAGSAPCQGCILYRQRAGRASAPSPGSTGSCNGLLSLLACPADRHAAPVISCCPSKRARLGRHDSSQRGSRGQPGVPQPLLSSQDCINVNTRLSGGFAELQLHRWLGPAILASARTRPATAFSVCTRTIFVLAARAAAAMLTPCTGEGCGRGWRRT